MSYWKTIEDLEAFARRPVHLKALKFLAHEITKGNEPHNLGVLVSLRVPGNAAQAKRSRPDTSRLLA